MIVELIFGFAQLHYKIAHRGCVCLECLCISADAAAKGELLTGRRMDNVQRTIFAEYLFGFRSSRTFG